MKTTRTAWAQNSIVGRGQLPFSGCGHFRNVFLSLQGDKYVRFPMPPFLIRCSSCCRCPPPNVAIYLRMAAFWRARTTKVAEVALTALKVTAFLPLPFLPPPSFGRDRDSIARVLRICVPPWIFVLRNACDLSHFRSCRSGGV